MPEVLKVENYQVSMITLPAATPGTFEERTVLILAGSGLPGYTIRSANIVFIEDHEPLPVPVYNPPILQWTKHRREYLVLMDLIARALDNPTGQVTFQLTYDSVNNRVDLVFGK